LKVSVEGMAEFAAVVRACHTGGSSIGVSYADTLRVGILLGHRTGGQEDNTQEFRQDFLHHGLRYDSWFVGKSCCYFLLELQTFSSNRQMRI